MILKIKWIKKTKKSYVPFIRGGHREVFEKPSNAILWSEEAINFYKNNKKNPAFKIVVSILKKVFLFLW